MCRLEQGLCRKVLVMVFLCENMGTLKPCFHYRERVCSVMIALDFYLLKQLHTFLIFIMIFHARCLQMYPKRFLVVSPVVDKRGKCLLLSFARLHRRAASEARRPKTKGQNFPAPVPYTVLYVLLGGMFVYNWLNLFLNCTQKLSRQSDSKK